MTKLLVLWGCYSRLIPRCLDPVKLAPESLDLVSEGLILVSEGLDPVFHDLINRHPSSIEDFLAERSHLILILKNQTAVVIFHPPRLAEATKSH